jgi:hypothetical protein
MIFSPLFQVNSSRSQITVYLFFQKSDAPRFKERNTILFREVHEDVVEADLRQLLQDGSENVAENIALVIKDVGKCWYVHFDDKYRQKGELTDCLLKLRTLSLKDEPIKARLKTERIYLDEAGQPQTPGSPVSKDFKARRNDRYQNNKHHINKNGLQRPRKPFTKGAPGVSVKFPVSPSVPPPGMSDSHFPTLGNSLTAKTVSATPVVGDSSMKAIQLPNMELARSTLPSSGYAAALLKPSAEANKPVAQQKTKPKVS